MALDIWEPRIVWLNGPIIVSIHDSAVARGGYEEDEGLIPLLDLLGPDDRLVGDSGYSGIPDKVITSCEAHSKAYKKFLAAVTSRGETPFKRLKDFRILHDRFYFGKTRRERIKMHKMCTEACAVIVQYDYENGHPPFDIKV